MLFSDVDSAEKTLEKLQETDRAGNVFVIIACDSHLKGVVGFFPLSANDFLTEGWPEKTRWNFLSDFNKHALREGHGL